MVGAMYGAICLSSQVGTGSSSHDLAGVPFSSLTTLDTMAGLKELKGDTWRVTSTGGSADVVDFVPKKTWRTDRPKVSPRCTATVVEAACLQPATELWNCVRMSLLSPTRTLSTFSGTAGAVNRIAVARLSPTREYDRDGTAVPACRWRFFGEFCVLYFQRAATCAACFTPAS